MLEAAFLINSFAAAEFPIGKSRVDIAGWSLKIGASLDVGAWNLVLQLALLQKCQLFL